jgi:hypothetical protein
VTEQEHHGFPWRTTALIVAVVVAASVLAGFLLSRDRVESTPPAPASPSATSAPSQLPLEDQRQVTLLLTVRDADRVAVSTVLLGVGGDTGFVAELMLPRDLLLPTVPPVRLEQVTDPTGAQTADQPLETLLGVQVDAMLDLDRLAWTGLIDATGAPVTPDAAERPGSFPLILDRVLERLPPDRGKVGELLTGLGSMARTTVTNEDASYLLALIGTDLRDLEVKRAGLPVTYLRAGTERAAVADLAETDPVVRELFPGALLKPGHAGQPRVVLQPAGAPVGTVVQARLDLVSDGFGVVEDRAARPAAETTVVYVPDSSPEAMTAGRDAASTLGLPASSVRVDGAASAVVDVRIVLGSDRTLM